MRRGGQPVGLLVHLVNLRDRVVKSNAAFDATGPKARLPAAAIEKAY